MEERVLITEEGESPLEDPHNEFGIQTYWVHYGRMKFGSWRLKDLKKVEIEESKSMKV